MSQTLALEPIEKASIDELRALQLKRLQATLHHAYRNSPVYRRKFDQAGVHPDDCRTLADLARFPMTTKADLRDHYPFGMFAVPREKLVRVHASSGTTGKPTVVGYTKNDIDTWAHVMARSIRAAGARPGDMVHVSYGYGLFTGGLGAVGDQDIIDAGAGNAYQRVLAAFWRGLPRKSAPENFPRALGTRSPA